VGITVQVAKFDDELTGVFTSVKKTELALSVAQNILELSEVRL
jgi:hypothetical protein